MHQGNDDYDYKIKCAIVGQRSVGKTSLLKRFSEEKFNEIYEATLGVEFASKTLTYNSKKVKLHIYDTAGQESFQSITKSYYKGTTHHYAGAHAIFFVYDITDETTFDKILHYWFD